MGIHTGETVEQWVFPALIGIALLTSVLAFNFLSPIIGVKSTYVLIGLVLSSGIYRMHSKTGAVNPNSCRYSVQPQLLGKLVLMLVATSLVAIPIARTVPVLSVPMARVAVLLVGLPIAYSLLAAQLRGDSPHGWILAQIVAIFFVAPVTKVQATNFYVGRGDTAKHVYYVDQVVTSGTWEVIPKSSFYHYFPGLHILLGSTSLLTGLSAYETYMIAGILTYAAVICITYLLARAAYGDRRVTIFVPLAASLLTPVLYYSTYFYPQALATALVFLLLLVTVRASDIKTPAPARAVLSVLLIVTLWVTHHLTVVLFAPILGAFLIVPRILDRWDASFRFVGSAKEIARPQMLPLAVWVFGSVVYWLYRGVFIEPFLWSVRTVLSDSIVAGGSGEEIVPLQALGTTIPDPSLTTAVISLFSPGGIYNMTLICIVALGVITILGEYQRLMRPAAFITVGLLGSILFFRTPLVALGVKRFRLPLSVFVAFVVGVGLSRLLSTTDTSLTRVAPVFVVFLLFATAGPVVAADDSAALSSGPNLWGTQGLPEFQKEYNQQEMTSFERTARFMDRRDVTVGTDWHSQIGLRRYGAEAGSMVVTDGRVETSSELLLYRTRWTEFSLRIIPERLSLMRAVVAEDWMRDLVRSENKVYTTGEVGMLADRTGDEGRSFTTRPPGGAVNESS